jgi:hypothetical protein
VGNRLDAKAAKTMAMVHQLAEAHAGSRVHSALVVMPAGTYTSGSLLQYAGGTMEDDATLGVVHHDGLPDGAQVLLAVTDSDVRVFQVRPKAGWRGLRYTMLTEQPAFRRDDLAVSAHHGDGLVTFELAETSTGRVERYETWTTYGNGPYADETLRWLTSPMP